MTADPNPSSPQEALAALQLALHRLQSYTLPAHAHLAIQVCLQQAEEAASVVIQGAEGNRLATLYQVSQSLGASLNLNEVLTQVMDAVIKLTGAERGYLILSDANDIGSFNPDLGMDLRIARSYQGETLERKDMGISNTVVRTVLERNEGLITTDATTDLRLDRQPPSTILGLRSILCTPLKARSKAIGVIYVDNRAQAKRLDASDLELLNTFASQAGVAIENARMYTRTAQALAARVTELEILSHIDRELSECLDLEFILETTRRWGLQGTGGSHCWIALCNDKQVELSSGREGDPQLLAEDDPLLETINQVLLENGSKIFHSYNTLPERLITPISSSGKSIGVLAVEKSTWTPELFLPEAISFLERLASRAAIAILNARLFQEVQDANVSKAKFISVVTHELRLPMTSIKGYADLMKVGAVGPVNEQQQSFLNIIHNNVDRMSVLISDLSDISRLETHRLKLTLEFIFLPDRITETVQTMGQQFSDKQQTLEISVPENLPPVYADASRVVQILNILLSNANKYTPAGGIIHILVQEALHQIRVEVTDNGAGISNEDQARLFTQFFRSDDPLVRDEPGWGLGLNIARSLVELMDGQMSVQSKIKEGSTFWFTLPTEKPVEKQETTEEQL